MALPTTNNSAMTLQEFLALRDFIYARTGIFFSESKQYFLENRLQKRLHELSLRSYGEYISLLQEISGKEELKRLFVEITTNETSFWRNPPQMEAFQKIILPEAVKLARERKSSQFKIWSAACSSGEEPFTIAMICQEAKDTILKGMSVEILATDISEKVLIHAKEGVYGSYTLRNLTPGQIKNYFDQVGSDAFEIKPSLRQMVNLKHFNLVDWGGYRQLNTFDVIFCRNVLIYFDETVKIKVIKSFYEQLHPKSYLLVGHSESIHGFNVGFELLHFSKAMGYRKRG